MSDYNGWKNYETWCVNLWLSNDEGLYREALDWTANADDEYELSNTLKDMIEDLCEATCPGSRSGASFVVDLLGAALSEVDWREIADAWFADARENA